LDFGFFSNLNYNGTAQHSTAQHSTAQHRHFCLGSLGQLRIIKNELIN
jgi:hypothetical protein